MIVKLLTEHHLEFLSLKGGCTGSSESTLIKLPHCWKSHALAHLLFTSLKQLKVSGFFSSSVYILHSDQSYQVSLSVRPEFFY